MVKSIDRGELMIQELKAEMEAVTTKHQHRETTKDDVLWLEDLLRCAKKKLAWEKQMSQLQKRTPAILEEVSSLMNNSRTPLADSAREAIASSLERVQAAMRRLEQAKIPT